MKLNYGRSYGFEEKNKSSGELDLLRYSAKGRSAGGNLLAKMLPTFENCLFKRLGIREESLVRVLLLSGSFNLPTDLGGVYIRKLTLARVSYRRDFLISYRVYMMAGSFQISLFEGTLRVHKMHV